MTKKTPSVYQNLAETKSTAKLATKAIANEVKTANLLGEIFFLSNTL
jgi:hypothetical protein